MLLYEDPELRRKLSPASLNGIEPESFGSKPLLSNNKTTSQALCSTAKCKALANKDGGDSLH